VDASYPLIFFDAIRVKIRDEGFVRNKAIYIALGILPDGTKQILGIWTSRRKARQVLAQGDERAEEPWIAVVDGLKGFAEISGDR
jgi:putative transposase